MTDDELRELAVQIDIDIELQRQKRVQDAIVPTGNIERNAAFETPALMEREERMRKSQTLMSCSKMAP